MLVPRIFQIICEIDRRLTQQLQREYPDDRNRVERMAIISGGVVRILAGYQMFGSDIFVREADAERAAELLDALFSGEAEQIDEESDA